MRPENKFLQLPTRFSSSRQHTTTFICCSLAYKPPKAALYRSCIVTYDVIYCARNKCGRTDKQTEKRGKRKAILGPAVCTLRALRLVKMHIPHQQVRTCSFKRHNCILTKPNFKSLLVWIVWVITWIRVRFGNNCMSNRQGNCMSEASAILPFANAITPK